MKRLSIVTIIILIAMMTLAACSPASPASPAAEPQLEPAEESPLLEEAIEPAEEAQEEDLVLTLEELSEFDGKDGKSAYIAVDGVIYDVTDVGPWQYGKHNGFNAGNDLTKEIKEVSPHGISKLANIVKVGTLAE